MFVFWSDVVKTGCLLQKNEKNERQKKGFIIFSVNDEGNTKPAAIKLKTWLDQVGGWMQHVFEKS